MVGYWFGFGRHLILFMDILYYVLDREFNYLAKYYNRQLAMELLRAIVKFQDVVIQLNRYTNVLSRLHHFLFEKLIIYPTLFNGYLER
mgnify:CR=1 FL=1